MTLITVLHVIASLFLILIILLQIGHAGSLGNLVGGTDQLFSTPSGSSFLRKVTIGLAVVFVVTSMSLTFLSYRTGLKTVTGLIPPQAPQQQQSQPAQPQQPAAPATK